jgi:hypothetical protein
MDLTLIYTGISVLLGVVVALREQWWLKGAVVVHRKQWWLIDSETRL